MARDEIRRAALSRDIPRHLAPLSLDALRIVDEFALALLQVERERPIVLQSLARQIVRFDPREPERLAIQAAIQLIGHRLRKQDRERAERQERARDEMFDYGAVAQNDRTTREGQARHGGHVEHPACNRMDVGDRTPTSLSFSADGLQAAAKARVDRERRTAAVTIGLPGDDLSDRVVVDDPDAAVEFSADRLTEISPVPAAIARTMTPTLDEDPEPYDSLEVEWDVSDIHAGEGQ